MADDLATVLERARTHATVTMADASVLLGRSLNRCYEDARGERGEVAGIPVIRLGQKSIRLPSRPLLRLVGLDDQTKETS
jgi:hypothetical protein